MQPIDRDIVFFGKFRILDLFKGLFGVFVFDNDISYTVSGFGGTANVSLLHFFTELNLDTIFILVIRA